MPNRPEIKPGDWIRVGNAPCKDAVVCHVYDDAVDKIEVVYLASNGKAMSEPVVWKETHWDFKYAEPSGAYADKSVPLAQFVAMLREGQE